MEARLRGGPSNKMSHKWMAQRSMWTVLILRVNYKVVFKINQEILKEHSGFYSFSCYKCKYCS